ncbi:MAG TPA: hypothetical protein VN181_04615 [Thermoanaerobaculia bacterium]|nr:hypothetical protein [Thermoanaerobaculia bacterium]
MASARKKSSSKGPSVTGKRVSARVATATGAQRRAEPLKHFAVCVRNDGYRASLELRKLYQVLHDDFANEHNMIRVVDESGDDYLYPNAYFVRVELPRAVEQALEKIA